MTRMIDTNTEQKRRTRRRRRKKENRVGLLRDGIDRRNFLGCMAWAGTGLLWSMVGGVPTSKLLAQTMKGSGSAAVRLRTFRLCRSATATSDSTRRLTRM